MKNMINKIEFMVLKNSSVEQSVTDVMNAVLI